MILIAEQLPDAHSLPDCHEAVRQRSVALGLQRMDFRHALSRPGPGMHRPRPPLPNRRADPRAPEWSAL
ncbi:MAG: hypothetical protein ACXIUZ_06725 [Lysobacteraceae bacterium]